METSSLLATARILGRQPYGEEAMECIEILEVWHEQLPLKIRNAWSGLRLPLSVLATAYEHDQQKDAGFVVEMIDAVEILGQFNPEAAWWWREHSDMITLNGALLLPRKTVRVCEAMPSLSLSSHKAEEGTSVRDFLKSLYAHKFPRRKVPERAGKLRFFSPDKANQWNSEEEQAIEDSPMTRAVLCVLSNLIASDFFARLRSAQTEAEEDYLLETTKPHYEVLYKTAVSFGLLVTQDAVERPLSNFDLAIRRGIIEKGEDGEYRLTELGEVYQKNFYKNGRPPS